MPEITIPRGTFPPGALPTAEAWEVEDGQAIAVPQGLDQFFDSRAPDPQVAEERWTLSWSAIPPVTAAAIRAHYRDQPGQFAMRNPRTGTVEQWRHAAPPQVRFENRATAASAQAFLVRLAAYR